MTNGTPSPDSQRTMSERSRKVWVLLDSLLDYLPTIGVSSGQIAASAPSVGAGTRVPCARCSGTGRVQGDQARPCRSCQAGSPRSGHACRECVACDGEGSRRARRGEAGVDDYVGSARVSAVGVGVRVMTSAELDGQLERLARDASARAGRPDRRDAYGWEKARRTYAQHGSYRDLERALERLRVAAPNRHALVWGVLVCGEPGLLGESAARHLDDTVELLAEWLPGVVRVPWWLERDASVESWRRSRGRWGDGRVQAARDEAMRRQARDGWGAQRIGEFWGVGARRVRQILAEPVATSAA